MQEYSLDHSLFNTFLKKNTKNELKDKKKIINRETKNKNIKPGYKNINKKQLINLIKTYHDKCKNDLLNSVYEYLLNEIHNNMWGEFSINPEDIDNLLFQMLLKKLHIIEDLKLDSVLFQDITTEECFNEISNDNLEENDNPFLDFDNKTDYITVEKIYDEMVYYNGIVNQIYQVYLNEISELFKQDFSNSDYEKIKKMLLYNRA